MSVTREAVRKREGKETTNDMKLQSLRCERKWTCNREKCRITTSFAKCCLSC